MMMMIDYDYYCCYCCFAAVVVVVDHENVVVVVLNFWRKKCSIYRMIWLIFCFVFGNLRIDEKRLNTKRAGTVTVSRDSCNRYLLRFISCNDENKKNKINVIGY